jgi:outer membrane receptor protein involved in Fe transport
VVNPRVGVNWEVAPKIHINAAWGTSYLAPAPHKIYDRYGDPSVFIGLPNENLKPERLMTYELGASLVPYSDVLVRVSGFGMDGSDLYNSIEYPQSTDPNSPAYNAVYGYSTAGNLAQMRLWGGQASAQSLVTSWLDLEADYMYVTGEQNPNVNTASETALVRMPKDLLNFRADFNFDPVRFGVSGNWFDNITTSPGNGEFFGGTYHGVWTFDGYLSYQTMIRGVETKLALTVKNMLDKQYYKISWSDDWAGVTLPELPQPRRTLLATLSFRF